MKSNMQTKLSVFGVTVVLILAFVLDESLRAQERVEIPFFDLEQAKKRVADSSEAIGTLNDALKNFEKLRDELGNDPFQAAKMAKAKHDLIARFRPVADPDVVDETSQAFLDLQTHISKAMGQLPSAARGDEIAKLVERFRRLGADLPFLQSFMRQILPQTAASLQDAMAYLQDIFRATQLALNDYRGTVAKFRIIGDGVGYTVGLETTLAEIDRQREDFGGAGVNVTEFHRNVMETGRRAEDLALSEKGGLFRVSYASGTRGGYSREIQKNQRKYRSIRKGELP